MQPLFLDLDRVLRTHLSLIEHYGGAEGVRDVGLLHSAIAMPQASFGGEFLHKDLFETAAAYLYHIVQNHPFVDGNKRTGAACAIIFLLLNGIALKGMKRDWSSLPWPLHRVRLASSKSPNSFARSVIEPPSRSRPGGLTEGRSDLGEKSNYLHFCLGH